MENRFMRLALDEAAVAAASGEIPVGAVIVKDGIVVSAAHNERESMGCSLRHAEITAIERACEKLGDWRLGGCDMYVTLEPCLMCTGAVREARIRRLYFGAADREKGYISSNPIPGEGPEVYCGIMELECEQILKDFFAQLRTQQRSNAVNSE